MLLKLDRTHFPSDNIAAYALVRKTEKIDESMTVKFAFIIWQGEENRSM